MAEIDRMALRAFRHLIEERTGLLIAAEREADLASAIRDTAASADAATLRDFFTQLEVGPDAAGLLARLVQRLVPQETYFFRDRSQLELIRREVLRPLRARLRPGEKARLWSAGCSSGEEALSLAILSAEELPASEGFGTEIMGTDLQHDAVARAMAGRYGEWSFRGVSPGERARWFEPASGGMAVRPPARDAVRFLQHDLQLPVPETWGGGGFDLIICRNVFIYYQPKVIREVLQTFAASLRPGGVLVLGHNEAGFEQPADLTLEVHADSILYRKPNHAAPRPPVVGPVTSPPVLVPKIANVVAGLPRNDRRPDSPDLATGLHMARRCLEAGDHMAARQWASRCLELQPDHLQALVVTVQAEANLGHVPVAEALVTRGLERHPLSSDLHFLRFLLLSERGDRSGAVRVLEQLRYLAPGFVAGHVHRARHLEDEGNLGLAADAWRSGLQALEALDCDATVPWLEPVLAGALRAEVAEAWARCSEPARRLDIG